MGTGMSFPKDDLVIAKRNRNAEEIHKAYCANSQFPISNMKYKDIELALNLDSYNKFITYKLGIESHKKNLTSSEIGVLKSLINPLKNLHLSLLNDENTEEYRVDSSTNENRLYLCGCKLIEISPNLYKFHSLTILQTCCNYLKFLPYGISQLKNLRILGLSKNQLSSIPWEIGFLKELRELDLANNKLTKLPKSLACLKRLNTLKIEGNLFTEIPSFLGKIQSLKLLNLSFNKIDSIPFEIFKLPFLMSLNTTGCGLKVRTRKKFESISKLTLKETAARNLIRKNQRVDKNITNTAIKYLIEVQECCFCGGPFFEHYVYVEDNHTYESEIFPIHYKMCSIHYTNHEERITTLFERSLKTFPNKLFEENLPPVDELFEPCSYDIATLESSYKYESADSKVPLVCIAIFNKPKERQHSIDEIFEVETANLNLFDCAYSL